MIQDSNDTIAAIASPTGEGAVGIIRISGAKALAVADRIFRGRRALLTAPSHTVHHGYVVDDAGERVDEVLATVFRSPHSYTGEDIVEIGCHGGQLVTTSVLQTVVSAGARSAAPGEFTRRAFLNGKLDLSQAEAVADLIASKSLRARRVSLEQLEGRLAGRVKELKNELLSLCSLLELDLDFSEEGLAVITRRQIEERVLVVDGQLKTMQETFRLGRMLRDGVSVVLIGAPNAGKSSIFNALLREDRAIVTHIPGTTRDSLQESISIQGVQFRLTDTAGLRPTEDLVEAEGVSRSRAALRHADIIVLVLDCTATRGEEDNLPEGVYPSDDQQLLVVWNKVDLRPEAVRKEIRKSSVKGRRTLRLSAKTGEGLEQFRQALYDLVAEDQAGAGDSVQITSIRHMEALGKARNALATALESVKSGLTSEFVAFDVRIAAQALAEITGEVTSEDVLNRIFEKFCIGK